jgi:FkbM family methyltransferase
MEGGIRERLAAPDLGPEAIPLSHVQVAEGVVFAVFTEADDAISQTLAAGIYQSPNRALLGLARAIVEPGGRILDLGAHIGIFALGAAAAGFEVIAVEAFPRNAAMLAASAARNGFERLRVVHAAVSDRPGTLEFCPGGPYGHVATGNTDEPSEKVPAVTVDSLLAELGIDSVSFIKMDIEGSEVAAVRGMSRLLGGPDAPPVYYESNGHTLGFFGHTPFHLKAALEGLGYANYIPEQGKLVPVAAEEFQPSTVVDYLALKRIPAALRNWQIDRPMRLETIVSRVVASTASEHPAARLDIARGLANAPHRVRAHRRVKTALAALRNDPDARVREAARAVTTPSWIGGLVSLIRREKTR